VKAGKWHNPRNDGKDTAVSVSLFLLTALAFAVAVASMLRG
jgi:hypothetical protein